MTLLGFKERFVPKIESREKRHTIRAAGDTGLCRFKVGDTVQLYRKVRQKSMSKIVDVDPVVTKIDAIIIRRDLGGRRTVVIGDAELEPAEIEALAGNDGFASSAAFFDFFCPTTPRTHIARFAGHIYLSRRWFSPWNQRWVREQIADFQMMAEAHASTARMLMGIE